METNVIYCGDNLTVGRCPVRLYEVRWRKEE
jgi:hypothetical protein